MAETTTAAHLAAIEAPTTVAEGAEEEDHTEIRQYLQSNIR